MNWFPLAVGHLDPYREPGPNAIAWAVHDNSLPGYHGLLTLQANDWLRVFDDQLNVVWEGVVVPDHESHVVPYENDPSFGYQAINGHSVTWVPTGIRPETWMSWFDARHRAVLWRPADQGFSPSVSPLLQALINRDPEVWPWQAPQRFFNGVDATQDLEHSRIVGDLQPAVAWISHALGWSVDDVARGLDIPHTLASEWTAPANLPWHRPAIENPDWEVRGAYLLALYAHLHWTVGERIGDRSAWPEGVREAIDRARRSFEDLEAVVVELAPDGVLLRAP